MRRERARRARRTRPPGRSSGGEYQSRALLLIGGFVVGALLEWVRSQPKSRNWNWQSETLAILLAAWLAVSLLAWWPGRRIRQLPLDAGLMLIVLFAGTLVMHVLINHR